jgi:hypothetical protein
VSELYLYKARATEVLDSSQRILLLRSRLAILKACIIGGNLAAVKNELQMQHDSVGS